MVAATYKNYVLKLAGRRGIDEPRAISCTCCLYGEWRGDATTSYNNNCCVLSYIYIRYTRNLVDAGNGKFNLMVLCWNLGNASPIHDHADSHCFMKMLSGELTEIRYAWPETQSTLGHSITAGNDDEEGEGEKPVELFRSTLKTDGVAYINGNIRTSGIS